VTFKDFYMQVYKQAFFESLFLNNFLAHHISNY